MSPIIGETRARICHEIVGAHNGEPRSGNNSSNFQTTTKAKRVQLREREREREQRGWTPSFQGKDQHLQLEIWQVAFSDKAQILLYRFNRSVSCGTLFIVRRRIFD